MNRDVIKKEIKVEVFCWKAREIGSLGEGERETWEM